MTTTVNRRIPGQPTHRVSRTLMLAIAALLVAVAALSVSLVRSRDSVRLHHITTDHPVTICNGKATVCLDGHGYENRLAPGTTLNRLVGKTVVLTWAHLPDSQYSQSALSVTNE